jgi:hypothetical protein
MKVNDVLNLEEMLINGCYRCGDVDAGGIVVSVGQGGTGID